MQSTVDWADEMSTEFQTESYSGEDTLESLLRRGLKLPGTNLLSLVLIVGGAMGALTNILVMAGLWLAGRSKINVSGVFIANHTTLEQSEFPRAFLADVDVKRKRIHPRLVEHWSGLLIRPLSYLHV